jgi:dihydrofolate synthase/folylpolyglutamate synthase
VNPRDFLASLEFHGIKLGLDNIRLLLEAAGNPQAACPMVHVAGTNGKGSVVAILGAILREAGYRAGRFTSPHLIDVNERFLVDGRPVSDDELGEHLAYFQDVASRMDPPPTYFEVCTAVALRAFRHAGVDVGLIEVGMGGRFDSTNIITPEVCAITNIDLDHQKYLGNTVEAIAFEKAGIIKPSVAVVVSEQRHVPLEVILRRAREVRSPVWRLGKDFTYMVSGDVFHQRFSYRSEEWTIEEAPLSLAGRFQGENAATAVALAERLLPVFPGITDLAVEHGLRTARWPCRMERVLERPPVLLDIAHNPAGVERLIAELPPCVVVVAVSSDKAASEMIGVLAPWARELILTQYEGHRALPLPKLVAAAGSVTHLSAATLGEAIGLAVDRASPESPALVTGSIFTVGQARRILMERYGAPPLEF